MVIGNAWKALDGVTAMEALDRVSEAVGESLRDGPLPRDDFHQALRERLPGELLWWCKGCGSHHVHPSLWRATGIRGVLAIVGREGRSAVFGPPPRRRRVDDPGAELARRFLRAYGPARPKQLAGWAGIATSHADALWERAGELVEVEVDGATAWALAEDEAALAGATRPRRAAAAEPRPAERCPRPRAARAPTPPCASGSGRRWAGRGRCSSRGEVAGLWRPAKKGKKLVITVELVGRLTAPGEGRAGRRGRAHRPIPRRRERRVRRRRSERGRSRRGQRRARGHSVVRCLKRAIASGAATARNSGAPADARQTGCCSGQAASAGVAVGLPNRSRRRATALTGFHSAICCSPSGRPRRARTRWRGTSAGRRS